MGERTPTPWHHGVANRGLVWSGRQIKSTLVANCYDDETEAAEQEANAAFIVKACNSYELLIKALKDIQTYTRDSYAMETAREALFASLPSPEGR